MVTQEQERVFVPSAYPDEPLPPAIPDDSPPPASPDEPLPPAIPDDSPPPASPDEPLPPASPGRTDIPDEYDHDDAEWYPQVRAATSMSRAVKDRVVNPLTGKPIQPGDLLWGPEDEVLGQGLIVSAVEWKINRTLWPGRQATDRTPLCRSRDGVKGFGLAVKQKRATGDCGTCPLANWREVENEAGEVERLAPPCTEELIIVVEFFDYTRSEVVYKKGGTRDFKRVMRAIKGRGGFEARPRFRLTSEHKWSRNRMDDWWVVKLTPTNSEEPILSVAREVDLNPERQRRGVASQDPNDPWAGVDAPPIAGDEEDDGLPW